MKKVLHIENLDCPVCAEALQSDLQKIKGVQSALVDYVSQTITVETEDEATIARVIKKANAFEEVRVLDGGMYEMKADKHAKEWCMIAISTVLLIIGVLLEHFASGTLALVFRYAVYALAYLAVGYPVLISTIKNIAKGRIFDENFLMAIASLGAVAIGETSESVMVMLLYQLGELLQSIAVGSSRRSVTELMSLKSETATLLIDGQQKTVAPESLQIGDVLLIKAGERVPVDGIVLTEKAVLDTKSLTGEAELRAYEKGEEVLSGCINAGSMFEMKVLRAYEDSAVGRILDMVENASAGKAAPEKFITKFAKIYTPIVCILALLIAVFAPLFDGFAASGAFYFKDTARWVRSALTFLVISCPCALIISVPLSYFSGIGVCAKNGILVKGATYLDILAKTKIFAFDKTGTLTEGDFSIVKAQPAEGVSMEELLALAASLERSSAHPIAKAFAKYTASQKLERVNEYAGLGLCATVDGVEILVGNEKLLHSRGVELQSFESMYTVIHVAKGGVYYGYIEIGDKLRKETKQALEGLKAQGITSLVMLTGDRRIRAEKIADEVGMYEVKSELLPGDKLEKACEYKQNGVFAYVGDGMNDAPVMAMADCAISMGKLGSAAAIEASDMVLLSDNLNALPKALRIARKTRRIVMQNIVFSIAMKAIFMALGLIGYLPLSLAVFADVGVMLLAVCNSFRVRIQKTRT